MTEVDLCAKIRAWAEGRGFVVYPEVLGWDLVLVPAGTNKVSIGRLDVLPGEQVGIHAKLRANCDVIAQAVYPGWEGHDGRHVAAEGSIPYPTWPVVAVPVAGMSFRMVAHRLGVGVLVTESAGATHLFEHPRRYGGKPLTLPSIASRAIRAGAKSPRVLSIWREKSLRFLLWARANDGRIRLADLKRFGISRTWAQHWLVDTGERDRDLGGGAARRYTYRLVTDPALLPDHGYEDVYAELAAEIAAAG